MLFPNQERVLKFMIKLQFAGKLFILGEYFIMEPGQCSVVCAVDRYLTIQARKSKKFSLQSEYGHLTQRNLYHPVDKLLLAAEAVKVAYEYLSYKKIYISNLDIVLQSDLLYEGKKIGLGSSGVVLVGIIATILQAHDYTYTHEELFKLAVLCQKRHGNMSSGGDLAAAVYGGCIAYCRYDEQWLMEQEEDFSLVDKTWPLLYIEPLPWFEYFDMAVYWSKKENDTDDSLVYFRKFKKEKPKDYQKLQTKAQKIVTMFLRTHRLEYLHEYRELMLSLEEKMGKTIEIEEHQRYIQKAFESGIFAKVSGSGGGDCAIALSKEKIPKELKNIEIGVDKNALTKKR